MLLVLLLKALCELSQSLLVLHFRIFLKLVQLGGDSLVQGSQLTLERCSDVAYLLLQFIWIHRNRLNTLLLVCYSHVADQSDLIFQRLNNRFQIDRSHFSAERNQVIL